MDNRRVNRIYLTPDNFKMSFGLIRWRTTEDVVDCVFRVLIWNLFLILRLHLTTRISHQNDGREWSFTGAIVLEFPFKNSTISKVMSLIFMKRTSHWLISLPIRAFTFGPIGVWFRALRLFVCNNQYFLWDFSWWIFTFWIALGFSGLLLFLVIFICYSLGSFVVAVDRLIPLDCFCSSRVACSGWPYRRGWRL